MKRKGGIIAGLSILAGINKALHSHKQGNAKKTALPLIYAGTWLFTDGESQHTHELEITVGLDILIDGRALTGKIEHLDDRELLFLDKYGYHLRVDAIENCPVSVYDEADNRIYKLKSLESNNT
ncbi:DUF4828 domain-containing protein [Ligilactobacillus sp. WILCCON 0076]|uniref:DUF4828 domain-containing protein n=1 Tax=Ligilactobacillus ubinensis TaxID=2876789 RepID=A0A9X2FKF5_9LACO|nr:DUF4828 domain-containing protein [Ligilactobacillus ubinensis]MCP0887314.1 DUF4828 domain-containing protein [Ligilactobacillus ubinensis]